MSIPLLRGLLALAFLILPILGRAPLPGADADDCTELLLNGNMENDQGWEFPLTAVRGGYSTDIYLSPTHSARLGIASGANLNASSSMRQLVHVPSANHLILAWRLYPLSQPLDASDLQLASIFSPSNTELRRVWSGVRNDAAWLTCNYDISAFVNRDIFVYFSARNNGSGGATAMYIDDVSLKTCSTPPTTLNDCIAVTPTPTPTNSPTPSLTSTPTPTPTRTTTPTSTPTPGPACQQLIVNPEFDQGGGYTGWTQNLILTSSFTDLAGATHTGAWFGGATHTAQYLYQDIILPAHAPTAQLTYLWALNPPTLDAPLGSGEALTITLRRPDDTLLSTLQVIGQGSDRRHWRHFTADLSPYRGQIVRLHAQATTSDTTTSWYLDQVRLTTCQLDHSLYLPLLLRQP